METASTQAKALIDALLHVYALTCMHRSSGDDEHRKSAAKWLPILEAGMASLKRELQKEPRP